MNSIIAFLANKTGAARHTVYWPYLVVILGFLLCFIRFPGEWNWDTYHQQAQALSGLYRDWHPPAFSAFWRLVNRITGMQGAGSGTLYIAHALMLWGGLALLARSGREFFCSFTRGTRWRFYLFLAILLSFGIFEMMTISRFVMKDTAMTSSYVFAVGILCNFPQRTIFKIPAGMFCMLLLFYGTAVRYNAIFAVMPLLLLLITKYRPQLKYKWLIPISMLLWVVLLLSIHAFNNVFLKAEKEHPLQEIFYGDIWRLNYDTHTFDVPPPVKGIGWEPLTEDIFFRFYNREEVYIRPAFKYINAYYQDSPIAFVRDFSGAEDDFILLFKVWISKIKKHPLKYAAIHRKIFTDMLFRYYFMGIPGAWYLVFGLATVGILIVQLVKKHRINNLTPYCVTISGLLYVLPYMIFIPDVQRRYLFWFFFASLFGVVWFAWSMYTRHVGKHFSEGHCCPAKGQ